jgi:HSP20 family protein
MRMLPKNLDSMFDTFLTPSDDMKCDIYEKKGNYYIEADMPGVDKKDVNVDYDNGYLTIKASKSEENNEEEKDFIRQERFYGSMERKFYIGDIDESKVSANFKDGVLKIVVPKDTVKKSTKAIEIK